MKKKTLCGTGWVSSLAACENFPELFPQFERHGVTNCQLVVVCASFLFFHGMVCGGKTLQVSLAAAKRLYTLEVGSEMPMKICWKSLYE